MREGVPEDNLSIDTARRQGSAIRRKRQAKRGPGVQLADELSLAGFDFRQGLREQIDHLQLDNDQYRRALGKRADDLEKKVEALKNIENSGSE